jgi:hypothetical protein
MQWRWQRQRLQLRGRPGQRHWRLHWQRLALQLLQGGRRPLVQPPPALLLLLLQLQQQLLWPCPALPQRAGGCAALWPLTAESLAQAAPQEATALPLLPVALLLLQRQAQLQGLWLPLALLQAEGAPLPALLLLAAAQLPELWPLWRPAPGGVESALQRLRARA